jgi:hypothetical protein
VAGTAEAGTIQYTALNHEIGFSATTKAVGLASTFNVPVVPGISAYFRRSALGTRNGSLDRVDLFARVSAGINAAYGAFLFKPGIAQSGQKMTNLQGLASTLQLGRRTGGESFGGHNGGFYELFAFAKSYYAQIDYGWIHLNESVSATGGPDVTILGIAYDTSGATIAAGNTGNTGNTGGATPEPSTAALASLSALALGAVGLRRWREVRKQAA